MEITQQNDPTGSTQRLGRKKNPAFFYVNMVPFNPVIHKITIAQNGLNALLLTLWVALKRAVVVCAVTSTGVVGDRLGCFPGTRCFQRDQGGHRRVGTSK